MPNITAAYQWAIYTCNRADVGYSQAYRDQQTVDGITYYDCSSFIWYALKAGGFPLTGYPFTTVTMLDELRAIGFQEVDINGLWKPGDIIWKSGHCEMVYSGGTGQGRTMGAHSANYPLERQVSINDYLSYASGYERLMRYTGGSVVPRTWIRDPSHAAYFTQAQMENNALCLRDWFMTNTDWSLNAIAALAANCQGESTINPDSMEHPNEPIGTLGRDGIGLVQWTTDTAADGNPLFMILTYLYSASATADWGNPERQCSAIVAEYEKSSGIIPSVTVPDFPAGWISTTQYPMSFSEWAHSTADAGYLALVFQKNYERPAALDPQRDTWGKAWYQFYLNNPYTPQPYPTDRKGLRVWQMIRYHL